jgi:RNA polymerase sigma-70 factor (sigma-E family)
VGVAVDAWAAAGNDARRIADERVVALFDAHYWRLCQLAYVLLGDPSRAEDAVQEAFLKTLAGWGRLRQPDRAEFYLRKAVLNQCRSGLRRRVTETRGNAVVAAGERTRSRDDFEFRRATELDVVAAVRRLPTRQREVVVLRYFLDLAETEIASTLGINVGTVKSQLSKARRKLATTVELRARVGDD